MKWLILLILLAVVVIFLVSRYRRQIQTGIYVFQMFRKMRSMGKAQEKQIEKREESKDVPLVRCAKCGSWIAQDKSMKLGANRYCSTVCFEKAAVSR